MQKGVGRGEHNGSRRADPRLATSRLKKKKTLQDLSYKTAIKLKPGFHIIADNLKIAEIY